MGEAQVAEVRGLLIYGLVGITLSVADEENTRDQLIRVLFQPRNLNNQLMNLHNYFISKQPMASIFCCTFMCILEG